MFGNSFKIVYMFGEVQEGLIMFDGWGYFLTVFYI